MKKITLILVLSFVTTISFAQSFSFKKCFTQLQGLPPTTVKINGDITLTDTTIIFVQNGVHSTQLIKYEVSTPETKRFMFTNESTDIRYSLVPNKDEYLLIMEMKDKFTNSLSKIMYYLNKK
jgi:hypothetical protein